MGSGTGNRDMRRLLLLLIFVGLVLPVGCALPQASGTPVPSPKPQSTPTVEPTPAQIQLPDNGDSQQPMPTSQESPASTGQSAEWKTYSSTAYNITVRYPPSWERDPRYSLPDSYRYSGADAFFMLSASNANTIDQAAGFEANHKLRPYGSNPTVTKTQVHGQDARLVIPSDDQAPEMGSQTALIILSPEPIQIAGTSYKYLVLWADKDHMQAIASTLRFGSSNPSTQVQTTPRPEPSPPTPGASESKRTPVSGYVSGRAVSVASDHVVVKTASQGDVALNLAPFRIWDDLWVKEIPIEVGDDITAFDPRDGRMPVLYVNIVNLIGTVSNIRREAGILFFDLRGGPVGAHQDTAYAVKVEQRARVAEPAQEGGPWPQENQRSQVIGRRLKDGSILATTVFFY